MNPFPRGTTHARAAVAVFSAATLDAAFWAEQEGDRSAVANLRADPEFRAALRALRPVVDCSGDEVITKPEAAPGTEIHRLLEAVSAGAPVAPFDPLMNGTVDQDQTLLDAFLIQQEVGRFDLTRVASAANAAAKAAAEKAAEAAKAAEVEKAERESAFAAFMAERRAKKAE